ncbi:Oidioi.mRNA.OKI2018_I69.XSR.g14986.t1.cds [Oikopleura dioica]|uniref:Oidioi.mRNA.OKI2018_I69.XSR.g14986.t1.cds n=1 Tax=Oikopleura dioica TaxID=34765 RepID=A0ABN7SIR4_OIKDI|nr:Oidioi.mRNA.OKI2018_I69.XSR.g14986.t1.cds [Oikopleura dioica]
MEKKRSETMHDEFRILNRKYQQSKDTLEQFKATEQKLNAKLKGVLEEQDRRIAESAQSEQESATMIKDLQERVATLECASDEELNERYTSLQKRYIELESKDLDYTETIATLNNQLNELKNAHETALKELAAQASKDEESSNDDHEDLRIAKVHNEATIKSLEAKLEILQMEKRRTSTDENSNSSANVREDQYEKDLAEALRKVDDLSIELFNKSQQLDEAKYQIEQLKLSPANETDKAVAELQQKLNHVEKQKAQIVLSAVKNSDKYAAEIEELKEKISELEKQEEDQGKNVSSESAQAIEELKESNKRLYSELVASETSEQTLRKEIETARANVSRLEVQNSTVLEEVSRLNDTLAAAETEINKMRDEIYSFKDSHTLSSSGSSISSSPEDLSAKYTKLTCIYRAKLEEIVKLSKELQKKESLENDLKVANETINNKDQSLQDILSKNTALSSKVKVLEEDLEEMKNEVDRKADAIKKMKSGKNDRQWSQMLANNGVPESDLSSFSSDAEEDFAVSTPNVAMQLRIKDDTIRELRQHLEVRTAEFEALEAKLADISLRIKNTSEDEIREQLSKLMVQIKEVRDDNDRLEQENLDLKEECSKLMEEQLAQPSSVESIQRQLDDLTEIVESKNNDEEKLRKELEELRARIREYEDAEEVRSNLFHGSRGSSPFWPDTLADSLAALNDENHFLRRNLSKSELEIEELKDQLEGTISSRVSAEEFEKLKSECLELRYYNDDLVTQLAKLETGRSTSDYEDKLTIQLEMINQMNEELEVLKDQLHEKDRKLSILRRSARK